MRVLRSGESISNEYQTLKTYDGQSIRAINTTMPIKENNRIIGAVDVSRYIDSPYRRQDITLESKEFKANSGGLYTVDDIITMSPQMEDIKQRIPLIADTDSSVLIYGETGTGKELVAESIHTASKRAGRRFVAQNCAAIPGNLLESILFGTKKGSYTGAENKPGLFEIANGGTLFLDEINSMEMNVQAKILKAIEEKQVVRLGGYEPIKTDIKVISAVNERPMDCVKAGKLREDLFYRLSVVQVNIPPLRERRDDILYMASRFIEAYNQSMQRDIMGLDEQVEELFRSYAWPGNVRELKNIIERMIILSGDSGVLSLEENTSKELLSNNLPEAGREAETEMSYKEAKAIFDRQFILNTLQTTNGNITRAADKIGLSRRQLFNKIVELQIDVNAMK